MKTILIGRDNFYGLKSVIRKNLALPDMVQPYFPDLVFRRDLPFSQQVKFYLDSVSKSIKTALGMDLRLLIAPDLAEILFQMDTGQFYSFSGSIDPIRVLGYILKKPLQGPFTIHLDLHNACNAACSPCWFHSPTSYNRFDSEWKKQFLQPEIFYPLIDDLSFLGGGEDLLFSGKGEPLLNSHLKEYIAYARNKGFSMTLFTNGILLSPKWNEVLIDLSVDRLYVSLSASNAKLYKIVNPKGDPHQFNQIINMLKNLSLQKKEAKKGPRVYLVCVLTHQNFLDIKDFISLAIRLEVEEVRFQLVHLQDYNRHLALSCQAIEKIQEQLQWGQEKLSGTKTKISSNIFLQMKTLDKETGSWFLAKLPEYGCNVGYHFSRIWAGGEVSFCCAPKVIGNLHKNSFLQIWRGSLYQQARNEGLVLQKSSFCFMNQTPLLTEHCYCCPNYEGVNEFGKCLKSLGL